MQFAKQVIALLDSYMILLAVRATAPLPQWNTFVLSILCFMVSFVLLTWQIHELAISQGDSPSVSKTSASLMVSGLYIYHSLTFLYATKRASKTTLFGDNKAREIRNSRVMFRITPLLLAVLGFTYSVFADVTLTDYLCFCLFAVIATSEYLFASTL